MRHAAHGCAQPGGWARSECVSLNALFSLAAGQVCQYVWQRVHEIRVFSWVERARKALFLLIVWGQGVYLLLDAIQWIRRVSVYFCLKA